jgi:hypothetical protein
MLERIVTARDIYTKYDGLETLVVVNAWRSGSEWYPSHELRFQSTLHNHGQVRGI